jgi:hypothetical protein
MDIKDVTALVHFRELHFLPRAIFFIGTVCFIGASFVKLFVLGMFGVGVMFAATALNLTINSLEGLYFAIKEKVFDVPVMLILQALIATGLALVVLGLAHYYYLNGALPPL